LSPADVAQAIYCLPGYFSLYASIESLFGFYAVFGSVKVNQILVKITTHRRKWPLGKKD